MDNYSLKFGVNRDNNASLGISKGRITISCEDLRSVFDAVISKIVTSCLSVIISQRAEVT
jgi:hypothetical protein